MRRSSNQHISVGKKSSWLLWSLLLLLSHIQLGQSLVPCLSNTKLRTTPGADVRTSAKMQAKPMMTGDKKKSSSFRLGYVTDVEGNLEYFLRFVEESSVLTLIQGTVSSKSLKLDLKDENSHFVYGGDAVDKGPGDIRLVRALIDLKQRYPNRVFLLVGNRDLNKLRFVAELSPQDMKCPISKIPPPHWDPKAPTLEEFLQKKKTAEDKVDSIEVLNTRVNRLHYILQHTLGCPNTFDFRRQELAILSDRNESDISDDEVVKSFLWEVDHPDGSLHQYMDVADVAVCIGNTLFCHGAVDQATMKLVPSTETKFENPTEKPAPAAMVDNVQEWTAALNQYLRDGMEDYRKRPHWDNDRSTRGGEALMALQNRPAMWGRSIVSNCYGDGGCITTDAAAKIRNDPERKSMEETNPLVFENVSSDPKDQVVADWLLKDGIQRVVVGHKPTGDCPAVLSALYTGVEIVSADTSFSDTSSHDNRGKALGVVEIMGESTKDNQLHVKGYLRDGSRHYSVFPRLSPYGVDVTSGDACLGTMLEEGEWWIKADVDDQYYLTRGIGRQVEYHAMAKAALVAKSLPLHLKR